MLWVFSGLTLALIVSLFKLRENMNPLLIIGAYLFSNIFIELSGTFISINLELTETPNIEVGLWTQKIASLGSKPLIAVWVNYFIFSKINWTIKLMIVSLSIAIFVFHEFVFIKAGYLTFENWNMYFESLRYIVIIILTVGCVTFLKNLLKKEMVTFS
ncbi:hypothetical protein LGQ02_01545 [Bacillus shivajii]|uniref:hypothetical protein n=1 Tax=Bacillus shivajii TaxID=1983719 RepID=UPI001CFB7B26|nr:hypothetical protein [Bacillus shivajii]UCZ53512.1 hypothetical protein LGQ02_01545 [Bacillus shivajii]